MQARTHLFHHYLFLLFFLPPIPPPSLHGLYPLIAYIPTILIDSRRQLARFPFIQEEADKRAEESRRQERIFSEHELQIRQVSAVVLLRRLAEPAPASPCGLHVSYLFTRQ
jgi:hypothetical protein